MCTKFLTATLTAALALCSLPSTAEASWITYEQACQKLREAGESPPDRWVVTANTWSVIWAGEVIALEVDDETGHLTENIEVRVTWSSKDAVKRGYACDSVKRRTWSDTKDFTHRSVVMYRCK
ncbi:hypothetical protein G6O69_18515 [Pseudenhygromyxa sp. WMMC2535]|uniref:hypothetical protein n=1 Tax=Pseudenhygromyxa sp. WMMC2535 TaxID=2712867 RepID=UPI001552A313|nr:hypothetical protein [Pseudenhygromyxa sp. WMMC2535]NVB39843.1 hypothetical protein [Pseudenhygromyxa sp. WMMC2535]